MSLSVSRKRGSSEDIILSSRVFTLVDVMVVGCKSKT